MVVVETGTVVVVVADVEDVVSGIEVPELQELARSARRRKRRINMEGAPVWRPLPHRWFLVLVRAVPACAERNSAGEACRYEGERNGRSNWAVACVHCRGSGSQT